MTPDEFEVVIFEKNPRELINFAMEINIIKKARVCWECISSMQLKNYARSVDRCAWRYMTTKCKNYKNFSVRELSFFDRLKISLRKILRIIVRYSCLGSRTSLIRGINIDKKTHLKIFSKLVDLIPRTNFENNKLGGPGVIIQIDETMLNYKCKSHRGRSPTNKTDALCIVEFKDKITRVFASIIPNKKQETIVPIICAQVASNSIIWTDEHKSYSCLSKFGYIHDSVSHKYEFITGEGVNTQAVESFNNCLKLETKNRKGILTYKRESFLKEFCFYWNNKLDYLNAIINLIKV